MITIGFGALTLLAAILPKLTNATRQGQGAPRLVGTMPLFLFAMSFVHFQSGEGIHTWTLELILHNAGIPLSLFVLLQDYRSVLADALIRFLANMMLACTFALIAVRAMAQVQAAKEEVKEWLYILVGALILVLFAIARGSVQRLLTKLVFRRGGFACTKGRPANSIKRVAQRDIGIEVSSKLLKYSNNGSTLGAVNFPEVTLPAYPGRQRLLHIHRNQPGVMSGINSALSQKGINIAGQYLQTNNAIGYVVIDIEAPERAVSVQLRKRLDQVPGTIRTRILF